MVQHLFYFILFGVIKLKTSQRTLSRENTPPPQARSCNSFHPLLHYPPAFPITFYTNITNHKLHTHILVG